MMRCSSRALPVVFVVGLLMSGCFGMHGIGPDDPGPDAGPDGQVVLMPPPPIYTGICGEVMVPVGAPRPTLAAMNVGLPLQPGEDLTVSLLVPGCHCGLRPVCESRLDPVSARIDLTTELCVGPDGESCDGCPATEFGPGVLVDCDVATGGNDPIDLAPWDVYVNGAAAFQIERNLFRGPRTVPGPATVEVAPVIDREFICEWPGDELRGQETCFPEVMGRGNSAIFHVRDACPGCFDFDGPCEVRVGAAQVISVSTARRSCSCASCGACDSVCEPRVRTCRTPVLEAPGEYPVIVNGQESGSLWVVDGVPEPPGVGCEERLRSGPSDGTTSGG